MFLRFPPNMCQVQTPRVELPQDGDTPDLLDSLIQKEEEERALSLSLSLSNPETLSLLLSLQSVSQTRDRMWSGRPITRGGGRNGWMDQWTVQEEQVRGEFISNVFIGPHPEIVANFDRFCC